MGGWTDAWEGRWVEAWMNGGISLSPSQSLSVCRNLSQSLSVSLNLLQSLSVLLSFSVSLNLSQHLSVSLNLSQSLSVSLSIPQSLSVPLSPSQHFSVSMDHGWRHAWTAGFVGDWGRGWMRGSTWRLACGSHLWGEGRVAVASMGSASSRLLMWSSFWYWRLKPWTANASSPASRTP